MQIYTIKPKHFFSNKILCIREAVIDISTLDLIINFKLFEGPKNLLCQR